MRMTNLFKLTIIGVLGVAAACSISPELDREMEQRSKDTIELRDRATVPNEPIPDDMVRIKNDIWLGDTSTIEYEGEAVPTYLEAKDGITLISNRPITLYEIGGMISKITSLSVRYAPELEETAISNADNNQPDIESLGQQWTDSTKMIVNYKGPLSGLLDEVANRFGIWWKYEKNEIYFYKYITKTFVLYTLPTTPSVSGDVSSGGEESSSSISVSNQLDIGSGVWAEVSETIDSMKTSEGQKTMNPASGTITVTDTPTVIKRIAKYINEMNLRMGKQVAISVKVLQVEIGDKDSFNLDLAAKLKKLGDIKATSWAASGTAVTGGGSLVSGIGVGKLDVDATIQALSTENHANIVTSGTVTTMNNKAAPIQVTRKDRYIKDISTTSNGDSDLQDVDTETEEFETGFTMSVLPRILDHGRLMMYFNMSLSDLIALKEIPSGRNNVQAPVIEARGFTQELAMKSGETLILTGYERTEDKTQKQGVGRADNMLLGGSASAEKNRTILVILLTPVVMESPLDPETRMKD